VTPPSPDGTSPSLAGPSTLSWDGPREAHKGDSLDLRVMLDAPVATRGLPLEIRYDAARLQFVDASAGDLFGQDGAQVSFSKSDDGAGAARVGVIRTQATGASGKGVAINLKFRAKAPGDAQVDVVGAKALGLEGQLPAPVLPPAWSVHVQ